MKALLTIAIAAVVISSFGCRQASNFAGRRDPIVEEDYPQIAVVEGLHRKVVFSRPAVTDAPNQPMSVVVGVSNKTRSKNMHIQYKFEFYDQNKVPVEPMMQWKYQLLPHAAEVKLIGAALDTKARDWRLVMRPAR